MAMHSALCNLVDILHVVLMIIFTSLLELPTAMPTQCTEGRVAGCICPCPSSSYISNHWGCDYHISARDGAPMCGCCVWSRRLVFWVIRLKVGRQSGSQSVSQWNTF